MIRLFYPFRVFYPKPTAPHILTNNPQNLINLYNHMAILIDSVPGCRPSQAHGTHPQTIHPHMPPCHQNSIVFHTHASGCSSISPSIYYLHYNRIFLSRSLNHSSLIPHTFQHCTTLPHRQCSLVLRIWMSSMTLILLLSCTFSSAFCQEYE